MLKFEQVKTIPAQKGGKRKGESIYAEDLRNLSTMPADTKMKISLSNGKKLAKHSLYSSLLLVKKRLKLDNIKITQRGRNIYGKVKYALE